MHSNYPVVAWFLLQMVSLFGSRTDEKRITDAFVFSPVHECMIHKHGMRHGPFIRGLIRIRCAPIK